MSRNNSPSQPLEGRAWDRLALIRDLAFNGETVTAMAKRIGVSRESLSRFKSRHAAEIADVIARADSEFRGIAVADKTNRLAMYQQLVEDAEDRGDWKLCARLLRQVAEEMGHLPSRMQITGAVDVHTTYTVTGADGAPIDVGKLT